MRICLEHRSNPAPLMPRRIINHDHHSWHTGGGIGTRQGTQETGKAFLQIAVLRQGTLLRRLGALHDTGRQVAGHEIERAKDIDVIVTISVPDNRAMPFEPEGGAERRDHGKPRLILTHEDEVAHGRFFLMLAVPRAPSPAGQGRLCHSDTSGDRGAHPASYRRPAWYLH